MFRNATMADLDQVAAIYDRIHTEEEAGRSTVGWIRGVYPTRQTALASIQAGDLFVAEEDGQIVATAKINQEQVPVYASAAWSREAKPQEVMVLHTLVVDPQVKGKGWGSRFVAFYEDYARDHGCRDLRMDTNERNAAARRLYHNLGYQEVSILPCEFNGIPRCEPGVPGKTALTQLAPKRPLQHPRPNPNRIWARVFFFLRDLPHRAQQ